MKYDNYEDVITELESLKKDLAYMLTINEDEDVDGDEFQRIFVNKFLGNVDYEATCVLAKTLIVEHIKNKGN